MENLFKILDQIDKFKWKTEISIQKIIKISQKYCDEVKKNCSKNNLYFRIAGQSGSGKTSQGLVAVQKMCEEKNISPAILAVRKFVNFHPKIKNLTKKFGTENIREITNGFALRCLIVSFFILAKNKCDIILEMSFLTKKVENLLLQILENFGYKNYYFVFSINKKISDNFISKRKNSLSNFECKRNVNKFSSRFFYKNMRKSMKFIAKTDIFSKIVIWNAFDLEPVFAQKAKFSYKIYKQNLTKIKPFIFNEIELLNAKILFLKNFNLNF